MGDASAIRRLFGAAARSPMWTREGVFLYPPKSLWSPLRPAQAAADWRRLKHADNDPVGLYVHLPAETESIAEFFAPRRTHPYIECLQKEADILRLPADLPLRTLYIGSGGAGVLGSFSAADIRTLLSWLRRRFRLSSLQQAAVEVDAAELTREKVRELKRADVDRVTAFCPAADGPEVFLRRRRFAAGLRLCRREGIRYISIDLAAGRPGKTAGASCLDAEFALSLKPDAVHLHDQSMPAAGRTMPLGRLQRLVAAAQKERGPEGEPSSAANNLQLSHVSARSASILGLGWNAVSHIRGRRVYGHADPCFKYAAALLNGRSPRYAGHPLDQEMEMRSFVVRSLEDTGRLDCGTFCDTFGREPEAAFPRLFGPLLREKRLSRRAGQLIVAAKREEARYLCSVRFYGRELLRRLAAAPAQRAPDPAHRTRNSAALVRSAAERLNAEGVRLFESGDVAGAVRRFERALRVAPENGSVLINRGAAAAAQDALKDALRYYARAARAAVEPSLRADALAARAGVLSRMGRKKAAAADLRRALKTAGPRWPRRAAVERELAAG